MGFTSDFKKQKESVKYNNYKTLLLLDNSKMSRLSILSINNDKINFKVSRMNVDTGKYNDKIRISMRLYDLIQIKTRIQYLLDNPKLLNGAILFKNNYGKIYIHKNRVKGDELTLKLQLIDKNIIKDSADFLLTLALENEKSRVTESVPSIYLLRSLLTL